MPALIKEPFFMSHSILPEWALHKALWTAWPAAADLWLDDLAAAQEQVAAMVRVVAEGERVNLLVMGDAAMASARAALADANVAFVPAAYGDIWLRDTGPLFARDGGEPVALVFGFNGWGEKYVLDHDDQVGAFVAAQSACRSRTMDWVLEGGSVDFDGEGRVLTTRQCLLNKNRNPSLSSADIEKRLVDAFGLNQIVWLDEGLINDHTDGHVDNIARFVAPNRVVCQTASGADDPNAATYDAIAQSLAAAGCDVVRIPSPGRITNDEGDVVPASHMNFIIGNKAVVMPTYEDLYAPRAVEALASLFPGRDVIGLPADAILTGGGSFHCITQQEPA
jgi:agmatine deiminase